MYNPVYDYRVFSGYSLEQLIMEVFFVKTLQDFTIPIPRRNVDISVQSQKAIIFKKNLFRCEISAPRKNVRLVAFYLLLNPVLPTAAARAQYIICLVFNVLIMKKKEFEPKNRFGRRNSHDKLKFFRVFSSSGEIDVNFMKIFFGQYEISVLAP